MVNELLKDVAFENFKDKDKIVRQLVAYMLDRTQAIYNWQNLPDTIPQRNLELLLQNQGWACIAPVNGKLYAFGGALGGEPNEYYEPTICTVANPYLKYNKSLKIGEECLIIRNDALYMGLLPLFIRYASLQAENAISLRLCDINTRIKQILAASDDRTKAAADLYLERIEGGDIGAIAEQPLLESLNVYTNPTSQTHLTDLIEYEQYIKASWYNEIGLNANYNMKRESINSGESQMNDDALLPLIDDMTYSRKEGKVKFNEMYGEYLDKDVEVELNSVWKKQQMIQLTEKPDLTDETSEDIEEEAEEWKEEDIIQEEGEQNEEQMEEKEEEEEKEDEET